MMNYIWVAMLLAAFISAILQGRMPELSAAVLSGSGDAVALCIHLLGTLCLWGGIMQIAQESGLTQQLCRLFAPVLRLIFPRLKKDDSALQAIAMNVTANLIGLGNAATPLGLEAMRQLDILNGSRSTASAEMVCFVVMNSAAIQLIPTTVAALRQKFGADNPMDIMPAVWVASAASLFAGLLLAKLFTARQQRRENVHG